jgi:hypothetical protein
MFLRLLISLFTLLWPPPPQVRVPGPGGVQAAAAASGITFVNANSGSPSALGTEAITLSVTAGNLIVVGAGQYNGSATFTVADSAGNTYTNAATYGSALGAWVNTDVWWAKAATTAALTITVTSSASLPNVAAAQFSGQSASPYVGYGYASGGTSPLTSSTFSSSALVGYLIVGIATSATGAGGGMAFIAGNPSGMVIPANGQVESNGSIGLEYVVASTTQTAASIGWVNGGGGQSIVGVIFH